MSVGDRVYFNSDIGTIRYVGNINGKNGIWYGIEWDDPSRGKNDGSVGGVRYFTSKSSTGASFIRSTSSSLQLGRTFLEALRNKYVDSDHTGATESIILGSSDGAIEVEAVNMNKVRGKFARLDTLKEVGLENYMIKSSGKKGDIAAICPNIHRLDLSRNLLVSWEEVVSIVEQLPRLESLTLHENLLHSLTSPLRGRCTSVTELRLNRTGITWDQSILIAAAFPSLKYLELGYNELSSLTIGQSTSPSRFLPHLLSLNLDSNCFKDWRHVMKSLVCLQELQFLYLSENQVESIEFPSPEDNPSPSITTLVLDGNPISGWRSMDAVARWLPNLHNFRVAGTPLTSDPETSKYARQMLIGRLASLQRLNSTEITKQERKDAEIFYLNWIVRRHATPEERSSEHPRWKELVDAYGMPEEEKARGDMSRLQNRLMGVQIYRLSGDPSARSTSIPHATFQETLRILPTMPLKSLRLKLLKIMKGKPKDRIRVFARLRSDDVPGAWGEIDLDSSRQSDLLWWGVEDGGQLGVLL